MSEYWLESLTLNFVLGAMMNEDDKELKILIDEVFEDGNFVRLYSSPFLRACQVGDIDQVEHLVEQGEDPNREHQSYFPLLCASAGGHTNIIRLLIEKGAEVNKITSDLNWTALIAAAYCGHVDACEALLIRGADRTLKTSKGQTALDMAKKQGHQNVVRLLNNSHLYQRGSK